MDVLHREGTEDTPYILLDREKNIFEISGKSLPENAGAFYEPVLRWIEAYASNPNAATTFTFKLIYFNTDTSKRILDLLSALEKGTNVAVHWYFREGDDDMKEAGEDFSELVRIPFVFKTYRN